MAVIASVGAGQPRARRGPDTMGRGDLQNQPSLAAAHFAVSDPAPSGNPCTRRFAAICRPAERSPSRPLNGRARERAGDRTPRRHQRGRGVERCLTQDAVTHSGWTVANRVARVGLMPGVETTPARFTDAHVFSSPIHLKGNPCPRNLPATPLLRLPTA
jgi:hypothetical protein